MIELDRFGLNRSAFPRIDIKGFFRLASRVGIHKVELRNDLTTGIIDSLSPQQAKDLAQKYSVRVITINRLPDFNAASLPEEFFRDLKDLLKLAVAINCEAIILVPTRSTSDPRGREQVFQDTVKALKMLRPYFEGSGVFGYIETLGFADCSIRSVVDAMNAIRESGSTRYKIVYDTFHHFIGPDTAATLARTFDTSHTALVHISGVTVDAPPAQYNDGHRVMVGPGDKLDNIGQLALLDKLGYRGNVSFEPFSREIQEMDLARAEQMIRESIKFVQNGTARSVSALAQAGS